MIEPRTNCIFIRRFSPRSTPRYSDGLIYALWAPCMLPDQIIRFRQSDGSYASLFLTWTQLVFLFVRSSILYRRLVLLDIDFRDVSIDFNLTSFTCHRNSMIPSFTNRYRQFYIIPPVQWNIWIMSFVNTDPPILGLVLSWQKRDRNHCSDPYCNNFLDRHLVKPM